MKKERKAMIRYISALIVSASFLGLRTGMVFFDFNLDRYGLILLAILVGVIFFPDLEKLAIPGILELTKVTANTKRIVRTTKDIQDLTGKIHVMINNIRQAQKQSQKQTYEPKIVINNNVPIRTIK